MELIRVYKEYLKVRVNSLDSMFLKHFPFCCPTSFINSTLGAFVNIEDFCSADVDLITDLNGWKYLSPAKGNKPLIPDPKKAIIKFPEFLDNKIQQQKFYIESLINEDAAKLFKSRVLSSILSGIKNRNISPSPFINYILVYRKEEGVTRVGILVEQERNQHLIFEKQEEWIPEISKFFHKDLGDKYKVINVPGDFKLQDENYSFPWRFIEDPDDKIKKFILENQIITKIDLT